MWRFWSLSWNFLTISRLRPKAKCFWQDMIHIDTNPIFQKAERKIIPYNTDYMIRLSCFFIFHQRLVYWWFVCLHHIYGVRVISDNIQIQLIYLEGIFQNRKFLIGSEVICSSVLSFIQSLHIETTMSSYSCHVLRKICDSNYMLSFNLDSWRKHSILYENDIVI